MKIYQVIIQDEYNNLFEQGYYKDLKDAVEDINDFLKPNDVSISVDELKEYPSTFGSVFDLNLCDIERFEENDSVYGISIRGFIYDGETLIDELNKLVK